MAMERLRPWVGAARRWREQTPAAAPPGAPATDRDSLHWRNVRVVAVARLLLAISNVLVVYLDDCRGAAPRWSC
jgi:hypothetical protein